MLFLKYVLVVLSRTSMVYILFLLQLQSPGSIFFRCERDAAPKVFQVLKFLLTKSLFNERAGRIRVLSQISYSLLPVLI